jgi:AAA+ superfamily predicted ATPase
MTSSLACTSKLNNELDIGYILYSNSLDIKSILEEYVMEFDKYKNKIGSNKIMYHFTYSGLKDKQLIFNSRVLSEENTGRELFETFDKIHNEHVSTLKKDIDKLKDIQYYKSHGLKRKKGYLFHGIPGCGKTSSVVAMALYDSRHIVEIPFGLLTTHDEFEQIMNLKTINNIEINNNNIILLFDEIDIGMDKFGLREVTSNSVSNVSNVSNEKLLTTQAIGNVIEAFNGFDCGINSNNDTTGQKINLATLLSKLDGIGNYNGLIIVGTTNNINRLNPVLYRDLRLTPIEFKQLRKCDCIDIIQSYFGSDYNQLLNEIIQERKITPSKLVSLCQTYDNLTVEEFFADKLIDLF